MFVCVVYCVVVDSFVEVNEVGVFFVVGERRCFDRSRGGVLC